MQSLQSHLYEGAQLESKIIMVSFLPQSPRDLPKIELLKSFKIKKHYTIIEFCFLLSHAIVYLNV